MPPSLRLTQTTPSATQLSSPLAHDAMISLQWEKDLEGRQASSQKCVLELDTLHALNVPLPIDADSYTFRLAKGTLIGSARASVHIELKATQNAPATPITSSVNITHASGVVPEREALTSVYEELNEELRRMRTLYETYLVVVTGGFATLVSKTDAIVGAPNRKWMAIGLAVLAGIVSYLLWQVSSRYNKVTVWTSNIETALGLRAGANAFPIMGNKIPRWRKGGKAHTLWAFALIGYTLALGGLALGLLWVQPNKALQQEPSVHTHVPNFD
jgi:hypothetical protein